MKPYLYLSSIYHKNRMIYTKKVINILSLEINLSIL